MNPQLVELVSDRLSSYIRPVIGIIYNDLRSLLKSVPDRLLAIVADLPSQLFCFRRFLSWSKPHSMTVTINGSMRIHLK
jgi:hypothetical protein